MHPPPRTHTQFAHCDPQVTASAKRPDGELLEGEAFMSNLMHSSPQQTSRLPDTSEVCAAHGTV